ALDRHSQPFFGGTPRGTGVFLPSRRDACTHAPAAPHSRGAFLACTRRAVASANHFAISASGGTIPLGSRPFLPFVATVCPSRSLPVMTTTKPSHKLSFRDRLSRLDFLQACKLLGPEGKRLIQQGAKIEVLLKEQVYLGGDLLRVRFPGLGRGDGAVATLTLTAEAKDRLHWNCTACDEPCVHVGGMFSILLEHKTVLGLAAPPKERVPVDSLDEAELVQLA